MNDKIKLTLQKKQLIISDASSNSSANIENEDIEN